ncbi:MAG: hypothetical protein J5857_09005 [Treponema sp.]|nr:hypothetical protein [Treponema sp.]
MNEERIAVTISPQVEELFLQKQYKRLFDFFKDLLLFSKSLKNSIMVCIPHLFQYGFKNCEDPSIKTLYTLISNPNSNIIFWPDRNDCNLSLLSLKKKDLLVNYSSIGVLSCFLKKFKIPLILSTEKDIYHKDECNEVSCINIPCKKTLDLDVSALSGMDNFFQKLKENCDKNLNEWIIHKDNIQIFDFRYMFYLAAFSMSVEEELYDEIKKIEFFDDYILKDIKKEDPYVLKDIATSILRAYLYDPAGDSKKRKKYSIDYHKNTLDKKKGFDLFRLDVVDMRYSGYKDGHSGAKRILLARKKGRQFVVAYVPDHEFSETLINSRIEALEKMMQSEQAR